MRTVWFIRHGQSVSNADLPTSHPADSALTPQGEQESRQLAAAFTRPPDLIVVSPFTRARQTAAPLQARFPRAPVTEWPVHEFTYLDPGRYQGTTGSQRLPHARAYWERNDPELKEEGGGESFAELMGRVRQVRQLLQAQTHPFIAVFSHGLFLRALFWSALTGIDVATPSTLARYSHFVQAVWMPNAAICRARLGPDGGLLLSRFDTAHLDGQPT